MKKSKQICSLFLILCLGFSLLLGAGIPADRQTVKVGYYDYADYMGKADNGDYIGFNFEYLQEIAKYGGWDYEIVECKSWENAVAMLDAGTIDWLPAVYYEEKRAQQMLFPKFSMCSTYTTLNVRTDDSRYGYEDFASFQGMKVGVIRSSKDAENFRAYCASNQIVVQIIEYEKTKEVLDALDSGVLDGVAITYLGRNSTYKSVAQFSPEELYTVVNKKRPELLAELNDALTTLKLRNPAYELKLYGKYFSVSTQQKPAFTKEELAYIRQAKEITAVYDRDWLPLEYTDTETGEFSGVTAALFREIAENTGLKFRFVAAANYEEAVNLFQDEHVDVICGITGDYLANQKNSIKATKYYLRAPMVMVSKEHGEIDKIAALRGHSMEQFLVQNGLIQTVVYYNTPQECFQAVKTGVADAVCVNTHVADYQLSGFEYSGFTATTLTNYAEEISIGVSDTADPRLFSILDKYIQYVSSEELDKFILKNAAIPHEITWQEYVRQKPATIIAFLVIPLCIIILLLAFLLIQNGKSKKEITKLLYRDNLTGLWNLDKFCIEAGKCVSMAEDGTYALLHLDIKQFRTINDMLGFAEGDRVLRTLSRILEQIVSEGEYCARVSGDQFVLLMHYNGWKATEQRTQEIDRDLNDWVNEAGKSYRLILVFGVYVVNKEEKGDISLMLDFANYARRNAVTTHKSYAVLYDVTMRQEEWMHRRLINRMQIALEQGEFIVYYQPKIDMINGSLTGSEALVRWNDPERGILVPGLFIPYFEMNGFIVEIDLYVYEQVCKALRRWIDLGWNVKPVSCNFSRMHFGDDHFVEKLLEIADRYLIPHHLLELEVTESVFIGSLHKILEHFNRLKVLGFPIAIDDFGSGYSSLGLLQQFSVDVIKLDRSFIQKGLQSSREQTVVQGIVNLAVQLKMEIICEGVENQQQEEILTRIGCRIAQGFYYARPMPEGEFEHIQMRGRVSSNLLS